MTTEAKPQRTGFVPNIVSALATGLFSIPEGMAYAQLAGVTPVYGLYSGVVATIVASLSTGTVLMMSTLIRAIALTTGSVLMLADIDLVVLNTLKKSGALDVIGAEKVFPATARVLAAANTAWAAAQQWLKAHAA